MQRLSGLDASFLYLETPAQPLHVCSILEIDTSTIPGGYAFDRLRDALSLRIKAMPEFREKLGDNRFNLDHPVWVEDEDFDVDRHLHRIGLPSPGGRVELGEICGHIASLTLDRSRPLWEMWIIENLDGTDAHDGGRLAVLDEGAPRGRGRSHRREPDVAAVHHRGRRCAAPNRWRASGGGSDLEIAVSGAFKYATRPLKLANVLPSTLSTVLDTVKRARSGLSMAAPFAAPKTRFNDTVTGHRNVAFAQLDLEDIKTVKNHFGVKVNDVVMALVAGVLRRYLARSRRTAGQHAGRHGPGVGARQVGSPGPQPGVGHVRQPADRHRGSR